MKILIIFLLCVTFSYPQSISSPNGRTLGRMGITKSRTAETKSPANPTSPLSYPNLVMWLAPGGIVVTGGVQTGWNDSSGNGFNTTGGSGYGANSINGIDVLNSQNVMTRTAANDFTGTSYTWIIVVNEVGNTSFLVRSIKSPAGICFYSRGSGIVWYCQDKNGLGLEVVSSFVTQGAGPMIIVGTLNATTGTLTNYYKDGSSYTITNASWDATTTFEGTFAIPVLATGGNAIGSFVAYKDVKSTTAINNVCKGLATRFGITWTDIP